MVSQRAAVVIIGGGVIGSSIAYYLTKHGCRDVVVLERNLLTSGSTSKAAGGIRQQFSTEVNVRLSQASVQVYEHFEEEFGRPADFHQHGYLFLLTEAGVAQFRRNVAMQQRLGVDVRWLDPAQAGELVPQLFLDDVLAATYCPTDGFADPYQVTQAFAQRAVQQGARILELTEVTDITVRQGQVLGVRTAQGDIAAETVVIAAGPWSAQVGRLAGVDLPVLPYQQHVFVTAPFTDLPARFPLTVDFASGLYFRREGQGILVGMSNKDEEPGFKTDVNWTFLEKVVAQAVHRVPGLRQAEIRRAWSGFYEVTPDHHPILGPVEEVQGLVCAAGFSGHGFMHAPAAGMTIAELIVDGRATTVDLTPLSLARFREGRLIEESAVI